MKQLNRILLVAACAASLSLSAGTVLAQGGGGGGGGGGPRDPAQFRQMRIDRMRDPLEVKDDAEWKVLSDAIGKVMDAQRAVDSGRMRGMGGFGGRNRGGGQGGGQGGGNQDTGNNGGGQQRQRGGFGTPLPEAEALQKAIDDKAPSDEIKAKLAALRAANKANDSKLEQTQDDLRKLLTARQEGIAVLAGLLK